MSQPTWTLGDCSNGGKILIRGGGIHGAPPQTHVQILPVEDACLMAAAPELLAALDETARLWHYNHADQPGSPCYNLGFSLCEGLRCATNRAAIRKATGG